MPESTPSAMSTLPALVTAPPSPQPPKTVTPPKRDPLVACCKALEKQAQVQSAEAAAVCNGIVNSLDESQPAPQIRAAPQAHSSRRPPPACMQGAVRDRTCFNLAAASSSDVGEAAESSLNCKTWCTHSQRRSPMSGSPARTRWSDMSSTLPHRGTYTWCSRRTRRPRPGSPSGSCSRGTSGRYLWPAHQKTSRILARMCAASVATARSQRRSTAGAPQRTDDTSRRDRCSPTRKTPR